MIPNLVRIGTSHEDPGGVAVSKPCWVVCERCFSDGGHAALPAEAQNDTHTRLVESRMHKQREKGKGHLHTDMHTKF